MPRSAHPLAPEGNLFMIQPFRPLAQSYSPSRTAKKAATVRFSRRLLTVFWAMLMVTASPASAQESEAEGGDVSTGEQYVDLQPEFILNYGLDGRLRYLRLEVTLLLNDATAATNANHHAPELRHIVVMNVSRTARSDLQTSAGRQSLRQRLAEDMQALLNDETGEPMVRDVLFSNLILQ